MTKIIDRDTLVTMTSNPRTILLEALPQTYFAQGHLPNARWFPHDKTKELAAVAIPRKTDPVVVYCASSTCPNSHVAAKVLIDLGYSDVSVYAGGKADWEAAGLPFEA